MGSITRMTWACYREKKTSSADLEPLSHEPVTTAINQRSDSRENEVLVADGRARDVDFCELGGRRKFELAGTRFKLTQTQTKLILLKQDWSDHKAL